MFCGANCRFAYWLDAATIGLIMCAALVLRAPHTIKWLGVECELRHFPICILQLTWAVNDMFGVRTNNQASQLASQPAREQTGTRLKLLEHSFAWGVRSLFLLFLSMSIVHYVVEMAKMLCGTRHNRLH